VPAGALACPECGSDDETGWSQDTMYDDLDLPDPPQSIEQLEATHRDRKSRRRLWIILVVVLVILVLFWFFTGIWDDYH